MIAASMRQALLSQTQKVAVLSLNRSEDLICNNIMCEKLGEPCVCKLARFLEQNQWPNLEQLELRGNGLKTLPPAVFRPTLKVIDLADNELQTIPEDVSQCQSLEVLKLSRNKLTKLPWTTIASLPKLQQLHLDGNTKLSLESVQQVLGVTGTGKKTEIIQ